MPKEFFGILHAHIYAKATCCQGALHQIRQEIVSVAEVKVSALFHAVHTLARFMTKQLNFRVELANHGFSAHRISREMVINVSGGLYLRSGLARHSQGR